MIGYYNVSVILTFIGLVSSVSGLFAAVNGKVLLPVLLLMVSGVCDMFDGKIARRTPRSDDARAYGIQIDSLCDLVCFGVFPAVMAVCFGVRGFFGYAVMCLYVLCAVIRLGFFNVDEYKRQQTTSENRRCYQGLPVTSIATLFPLVALLKAFAPAAFPAAVTLVMLAVAVLFVLNVRIPKPHI